MQHCHLLQQFLPTLTPEELLLLRHEWPIWARLDQLPPGNDWRIWLILAGRGWGKTRTGAEWVRSIAENNADVRIALVGETANDARQVMVEGESGLLAIAPPWAKPAFLSSKRELHWPNGAMAQLFSAEDPEQLRGPQFSHAWCDEVGKWRRRGAWDNLLMGLRLGDKPQVVATTTPRPTFLIKQLVEDDGVIITRGKTLDNAGNLPAAFLQEMQERYAGTRLGRQELDAELLLDTPGALWQRGWIQVVDAVPALQRVVVAIDPAVGPGETGIVAAGLGADDKFYVLDDATSQLSPEQWARRAVSLCEEVQADRLIAERNNGGDLVKATLQAAGAVIPVSLVHASRGKLTRAEPVATLYEQGRVLHGKPLPELEDQLCGYTGAVGEKSPDRMDALVWALTALLTRKSEHRVRGL